MVNDADADIPFYLMPVAALLGMIALFGGIRILWLLYGNLTFKEGSSTQPSVPLISQKMLLLVMTVVVSIFGYAKIVAHVDYAMAQSEYALFDPFDILGVELSSNSTEIKHAYRTLSLQHHPDKGGDKHIFHRISTAYRALTTDKDNFDKYGHPDGPLTSKELSFALPNWLLQPKGKVAVILLILYLGLFVVLIYFVISWATKQNKAASIQGQEMSVAVADTTYLAATLSPESTHMDILFSIATAPESISITEENLKKIEEMKKNKQEKLREEAKKKSVEAFDLDDSGWDDEDNDDATKKAKQEEALKLKAKEQLAEAQGGNYLPPIEGVDDGVLGQKWVEKTLEALGKWPPKSSFLDNNKFKYKGKTVSALEHPAIRRNLCYTMGRLNAFALNNQSDLIDASSKKKLDETYFKGSMMYRQRVGLLQEAVLRLAATLKSYSLAKTVLETAPMFKVGVEDPLSEKTINWFKGLMQKQYTEAGLAKLEISDLKAETPGEDEIATGDMCAITMTVERIHAEAVTKVKIAMCQKQGIPPQVAFQSYSEGWWVLVRAKKLDGGETQRTENVNNPLLKMIDSADIQKFDEKEDENRLLVAWPMIVQNMAQKTGKVKIQFRAPSIAGQYKILMAIKSQEFFGADMNLELPLNVLDSAKLERKEKEEVNSEGIEEESKKKK